MESLAWNGLIISSRIVPTPSSQIFEFTIFFSFSGSIERKNAVGHLSHCWTPDYPRSSKIISPHFENFFKNSSAISSPPIKKKYAKINIFFLLNYTAVGFYRIFFFLFNEKSLIVNGI